MKTQKIFLGILAVLIILFVTGCQFRLQKSTKEFIEAYNNQDMQSIAQMTLPDFAENIKKLSENMYAEQGKISDYKFISTGFSSKNGNKKSYLIYECSTEKSDIKNFFRINFIQKNGSGSDPNIIGFFFSNDKEFIENIDLYDEQASAVMDKFYNALINGQKEDIFILLDKKSFPDDKLEDFISILNKEEEYYGKIKEYSVNSTESYIDDGKTFVIKLIECTTESGIHYDEITFVKSGNDFKIYYYRVRENIDEF